MQGQQDQYISYCLTLNPSNLTRNEACNVLRLNPDETLSEDQIKKAYRKQSLVYHPDKNSIGDNRKYTEVFQRIMKAFELLMGSLNNDRKTETHYQHSTTTSKQSPPRKTTNSSRQRASQNADRKNRGSEYNHREPSWLYTVKKCLVGLAKEGLSELKEQSPRTFNENYLGQMGWRVPATALVMKGIERLVRQKNYELLRQKIECIGNAQRFKRIMDVHISKDFAGEFHSFIGETRVSSFNIDDIAGLRINPYDREHDFYHQLLDVVNFRVELYKQSPITIHAYHFLDTFEAKESELKTTEENKKILQQLHTSFRKRALNPKTQQFRNKRDEEKNACFERVLQQESITKAAIEEVVNIRTGRYTFGFFNCFSPTSKKEYDDILNCKN